MTKSSGFVLLGMLRFLSIKAQNPYSSFLFVLPSMASQSIHPHFVLVPLMTQGHMIDFARLLASHGVKITLVTSPTNALRFASVLGRSIDSGLGIQVAELDFPVTKAGLTEGCENLDMVPSPEMTLNLFEETELLRTPFEELFTKLEPRPQCVISRLVLSIYL